MKNNDPLDLINKKNQWLAQQVAVEYPTPQSVLGKNLYLAAQSNKKAQQLETRTHNLSSNNNSPFIQEFEQIYLVDFHRLTISFAQLQSLQWSDPIERANVLEFLTQIILSEPARLNQCHLFIAFNDEQAVISAIIYLEEKDALISDIVIANNINNKDQLKTHFIEQLIKNQDNTFSLWQKNIWIEQ